MSDLTGYPLVDVFAGPGGLGEGFSSLHDQEGAPVFRSAVSIEQDKFAHQTLVLRHFFKLFRAEDVPEEYYDYISGGISFEELKVKYSKEFEIASSSVLKIFLGPENHSFVKSEINSRIGKTKKWALVGGPPCQAYSLVGRSRMTGNPEFEDDPRHFLYKEYLQIIIDHRPPVFVMENVKGLLSAKIDGNLVITKIVSDLSCPKAALGNKENGLKYNLYSLSGEGEVKDDIDPRSFLVKAEEYGVPQARHRMFIVGVRNDLSIEPAQLQRKEAPTVRETIGSLPKIRSGISKGVDNPQKWQSEISDIGTDNFLRELAQFPNGFEIISKINNLVPKLIKSPKRRVATRYQNVLSSNHAAIKGIVDKRIKKISSHESRGHMPSDLRRYFYSAIFSEVTGRTPKLSDFPKSLLPNHKNVELGRSGKMFSDRFRVQLPDKVSTTITSHISKDGHYFIHFDPLQSRSLTVREAARLQTFPDNYHFEGPRTSQYHQVGNAVPPYLAKQIGKIVASVLDRIED